MSRTVTLRLDDSLYEIFKKIAEEENRTISNFIETATLRYLEEIELVDEYEMEEIRKNKSLNESIKKGLKDAKAKQGRFVE
jgi:predicted transcriptional regulator